MAMWVRAAPCGWLSMIHAVCRTSSRNCWSWMAESAMKPWTNWCSASGLPCVRVDDAQFDAVVGAPDAAALARSPLPLVP
jgi:hypothetical protein